MDIVSLEATMLYISKEPINRLTFTRYNNKTVLLRDTVHQTSRWESVAAGLTAVKADRILKLQWLRRWSLRIENQFHFTRHNGCNYVYMLGLELIYGNKRGHTYPIKAWIHRSGGTSSAMAFQIEGNSIVCFKSTGRSISKLFITDEFPKNVQ